MRVITNTQRKELFTKAFVAALLLMLTAVALSAQRRPYQAEESKIMALENAWNLAEEHKDVSALSQLLADTLVYVDDDGSFMNKAQFLASRKNPAYGPEQIVNDDMTVHMYGNTAVVTGVYRDRGVNKGKSYSERGRFTDTWVYENGLWLCVASQSTLLSR